MQTNDFFVFWKIFELKFHFTFEFPRSSQSYVVEESIGGQEWRIHAPCSDPRGSISPSSCRESKLDSLHFLKATSNWPTNHHQLCHHLEQVPGKASKPDNVLELWDNFRRCGRLVGCWWRRSWWSNWRIHWPGDLTLNTGQWGEPWFKAKDCWTLWHLGLWWEWYLQLLMIKDNKQKANDFHW